MRRDHHMRRKGEVWFFQMAIPAELQRHYAKPDGTPKKTIEKSLGTKDPAKARLKRDVFHIQQRAEFDQLKMTATTAEADAATRRHAARVKEYERLRLNPLLALQNDNPLDHALTHGPEDTEGFLGAMEAYTDQTSGQQPPPLPRGEPVDSFLDKFLEFKSFSPAHAANTRRAVTKFAAWLDARGIGNKLGRVTREVAGDYLDQVTGGRKSRVNVALMLSSYCAWLVSPRGKLDANPFEGLSSGIEARKQSPIDKRAFDNEDNGHKNELATLLANAAPDLSDAIRVLALSGMRASELCSLTVSDCRGELFRVHGGPKDKERKGKTEAAKREIPIHSDLTSIVERLRKGRAGSELLFPQWRGKSRGLGKRFHELRIECGVDDRRKDQRQSEIDMHSLRRWFAMKAGEAIEKGATGFTPWTLAHVMGHSLKGKALAMTMDIYKGAASLESKRSCVESVKLPPIAATSEHK